MRNVKWISAVFWYNGIRYGKWTILVDFKGPIVEIEKEIIEK